VAREGDGHVHPLDRSQHVVARQDTVDDDILRVQGCN